MERIENAAQLQLKIMHLKGQRFEQEEELKRSLREFAYRLNPVNRVTEFFGRIFKSDEKSSSNAAFLTGVLSLMDLLVLRRPGSIKTALLSVALNMLTGNFSRESMVALKDKIVDFVQKFRKPPATTDSTGEMEDEISEEPMAEAGFQSN